MSLEIQTQVEWLIPSIQSLNLEQVQINGKIAEKEQELANHPDVIRINNELLELRKNLREAQSSEMTLRDQWKQLLIDSGMKEFTTLDGTTVALQFTPWALVIWEGAKVPDNFMRTKTTTEVDKTAIKKALWEWVDFWPDIYIQKEAKLVIKQK